MSGTEKIEVKNMTTTERRELRRIVKRRFKVLREQIDRREHELEHAIREQIREENKALIKEFKGKFDTIAKAYNKLVERMEILEKEATAKGVSVHDYGAFRYIREIPVEQRIGFYEQGEIYQRISAIKEEAGWNKLSLEELEWQIDEQLAIGELKSGTSLQFLEALPTVDTLLPLPVGVKLPELEI